MANYYIVRTRINVEAYVNKGVSAVGWSDVVFTEYENVEELCDAVRNKCYNNESSTVIGRKMGEIRRFRNIKKGDIILVPCYKGFYIGEATGRFIYDVESIENDLSNQVELDYVKRENSPVMFSRDGKLTALSSKLGVRGFTVLCIKEDEIINEINILLESGVDSSYQDRAIRFESEKANEFREMLISALSNYEKSSLKAGGRGFEELIAAMMKKDGYESRILSKRIGGNSESDADVLAIKKSTLGDEFTMAYYIQAKHYSGSSNNGIKQIIAFKKEQEKMESEQGYISVDGISLGSEQIKYVLISSGEFTEYVKNQANENNIILIDGYRLAEILFDIIDELPEIRYQLGFVKKYDHI
ncbi:restriction endonuclease [Agathobacter ruminis]|uniref:Restriction endonuclease type IV Mrr domain-containing protein n=1 Tax=Agathobacter ruminis TaxID=1712665 RepID=A0A2G3E6M4_9FIRM|nr:restriction endonuclease [Agathobacter ruminis]MDC7300991.1 restriction endonuclease [Agathobacter ruminis]PHU38942.1 hypothetical protein CSX02_00400 [Agathobacter ruminis]